MKSFACLNKSLLTLSLLFILSLIIVPSANAEIRQVTNNDNSEVDADTDGNKIVWRGAGSVGRTHEIFLYDIQTQATIQLTDDDFTDVDPRVGDGKVIWESFRANHWVILIYDIATATTVPLTDEEFNAGDPDIDAGKIVWAADNPSTDAEIFVYDIASGTTTQVTDNTISDNSPQVSNGLITWSGHDGIDSEIYLYNIATATTTQITDNTDNDDSPQISDGKITWVRNSEIFYYDVATGSTTQITNSNLLDQAPQIDAGKIVWQTPIEPPNQNIDIFLYDTVTGNTTRITDTPERDQAPRIKDGHVLWLGLPSGSPAVLKHYDLATGETIDLYPRVNSREFASVGDGKIVWIGQDETLGDFDVFLWQEDTRQLTALAPANVWVTKNVLNFGVRFDFLAEVYKDNTLVSSGQVNSIQVGSGSFNQATQVAIPFNTFSAVDFPAGSALKVKVSVRNACSGSLLNNGTATLWYNTAQQNSRFGATIEDTASDYYLRDAFALATAAGSGPRRNIAVAAGARCSAFKTFGTWTITP